MKKLVMLMLCLVMVLSLAACKPSESGTPSTDETLSTNNSTTASTENGSTGWDNMTAVQILQKIAEKADTQIMAEVTDGTDFYLNALTLGQLEFQEIALYMPMISSQRFEVAVIRVKEGTNVNDYVADLEDRAANAQWICAAPPDFVKVVAVGDCVLYMAITSEFANEQAMIDTFQNPVT